MNAHQAFMGMVISVKMSMNARSALLVNVMVAPVRILGEVMSASARATSST